MSHDEALALAAAMANEECMKKFSAAPFDMSSYPIQSLKAQKRGN